MGKIIRQSVVMLVLFTIVTGIAYPLLVTGIAQVLFPRASNGSLIERDGKPLGSELIGQAFADPKYFWGRPSATAPFANNSAASGGSNLGPTNPALADAVKQRVQALHAADPSNAMAVPVDLVTTSASGLDPHISPAAANYQIARVARLRGLAEAQVSAFVARATDGRQFGVLGEPRVNVLKLNLALDGKL
ncbi:MAG: potassium-transporting ATPase subunit KdpC [Dokdonella sp.]|uniref:potassium-transporting ATPase subunit KdpC n=1 Tax=Dokdonella sp. TaxID=2291710 RepID=UPI00326661AB